VQIRVLGQIDAVGDQVRSLGGPTQRRILGILALHHGEVVSVHRLIDATWNGDAPARAERNVHSYVHRLRQALDSAGHLIETVGDGYRLHMLSDELDFDRFDTLAATAHRLAEREEIGEALDAVREAMALWRGRPFGEFADEEWAEADVHRLTELHVALRELRAELLLRAGRSNDAVVELERLVAEHPLRERPRALHMQALYHSGRHAEALRAFQQFRRHLVEEVGVGPSDELVELDRRIVEGTLDSPTSSAARTVGAYRLGERIGEGAFAVVYRATQTALERDVAVKVIRAELANRPEFVRRFTAEAQMVARIEHPNVVPLYDYWREPDHAYLVMRLMTGGTLEQRLDRGPLDLSSAVDVVDQIAAALDAAHRLGVVHRDVKPENIMFDDEGRAYLADFGIALEAAERSRPEAALSEGSPLFASPEQLRREPAGPESDVFSLGIVAFTMLVGDVPFADSRDDAERLRRQLHEPLPSTSDRRNGVPPGVDGVPPGVDGVIAIATAKDPGDRYPVAGAFAAALRAAAQAGDPGRGRVSVLVGHRNPYKGLRPFDETDADDFFGRARLVDELVASLAERPVVAVVGPSGAGKSSVVRAGLVPALRRGAVPGSLEWFVATMTPGRHPFEALETALLRIAVNPPGTLLDQLRSNRGLLRAARRVLPDDSTTLLLILDQFEELFTNQVDPADRDAFLQALVTATSEPGTPVRLVLTLRADFYDRPLQHPVFAPLLKRSAVTVTPLAPDELERAIVEPAASTGVDFEPGLVARMVADFTSRPGALPLLQYTLTRLMDGADGAKLREADYDAMGGLAGSLGGRAEQLWDECDADEQTAARRLFERLVTLGEGTEDTRRRVLRSELGDAASTEAVLDRFGRARLLTFDRDPATREPTVEVAHEALIQRWPRLREWLDEDRDARRAHRHLMTASTTWTDRDRDPSELYRGSRLDQVELLIEAGRLALNRAEAEFLAASSAQREREDRDRRLRARRLRRFAVGAAVLAVFAIVASIVALLQRNTAAENRALAERRATESDILRLATESESVRDSDPDLAILLGLAAADREIGLDGLLSNGVHSALQTAVSTSRLVGRLPTNAWNVAMRADGSQIAVKDPENPTGVVVYGADHEEIARFGAGDVVAELEFSPDGGLLLVHHHDNDVELDTSGPYAGRLFETTRFTEVGRLGGPCCRFDELRFSPDGQYLVGGVGGWTVSIEPSTAIWDVESPDQPRIIEGEVTRGFLGESGALLLLDTTPPEQLRWIRPSDLEEIGAMPMPIPSTTQVSTDPTQDRFAVVDSGLVSVWQVGASEPEAEYRFDTTGSWGHFSLDGRWFFVLGNSDRAVAISLESDRRFELPGNGGGAVDVGTNSHDDRVAIASWSDDVLVWDLSPQGPDRLRNIATRAARSRVFDPPGVDFGGIAVTEEGGSIRVSELADGIGQVGRYDAATGRLIDTSDEFVDAPQISPLGVVAAGRISDDHVRVDRLGTGASIVVDTCGEVIAVDDDGRRLVMNRFTCRSRDAVSEVEAGAGFDALGGDGVEVALAEHDVVLALDLDLVAVVGAEQHLVADLGAADVLAEGHHLGPHEPLGHLRRGRDEDAARRRALAVLLAQLHEQRSLSILIGIFWSPSATPRGYRRPVTSPHVGPAPAPRRAHRRSEHPHDRTSRSAPALGQGDGAVGPDGRRAARRCCRPLPRPRRDPRRRRRDHLRAALAASSRRRIEPARRGHRSRGLRRCAHAEPPRLRHRLGRGRRGRGRPRPAEHRVRGTAAGRRRRTRVDQRGHPRRRLRRRGRRLWCGAADRRAARRRLGSLR
jgi:serine/threonine protein kinase/DNA-binding winged helix-turn-helix (wHTH) protein